ncbi:uncharacterized protein BCR38DRAFT_440752 [Pseudomassariella vexata]|uniref:Uncharacterized protein n=1 Tax=Pseudomassariella vexata TaxID=1141098 RepID=A0A1Y2DQQ4_9PEZI|nr:uncharacterized protein BCR38DRAFT_440752 [Pseudomassariella vexata]ORY61633.1 hypothetical protein BCR38DRAFT_440752 [Pseudomassariella vexata]
MACERKFAPLLQVNKVYHAHHMRKRYIFFNRRWWKAHMFAMWRANEEKRSGEDGALLASSCQKYSRDQLSD